MPAKTFDQDTTSRRRGSYRPPTDWHEVRLSDALEAGCRDALAPSQLDLLRRSDRDRGDVSLYVAGDTHLFSEASVSIVGTREVSEAGRRRAMQLSRDLVRAGVVVVSGLAKGVDAAAHMSAIEHDGRTIAVIGTPLDKAYPAENSRLQMEIYEHHLLVSPFREGEVVFKTNFPKRNRVMAAVSDATVIIEASDTSGTLHQAVECQKLGRWLFIASSVATDPSLSWPAKFLDKPKTAILTSSQQVIDVVNAQRT
ncbi:MAG: DNA-protecting protein DprA [Rhizobiales bacterium]|nr:DNA-protecting protein DprA [Hyphomicrobiales bacterium]